MLDLARIARDGGILALASCIYLPFILRLNPRFAREDLSEDIQQAVPPLTKKETRTAAGLFALILAVVLGISFVSTWGLRMQVENSIPFFWLFINAYGVLLIANIGELLVVDLLLFCSITPRWMVIPGTDGMAGYKDYRYQMRAHLRGAALMVVVALSIAGLVSLLDNIQQGRRPVPVKAPHDHAAPSKALDIGATMLTLRDLDLKRLDFHTG